MKNNFYTLIIYLLTFDLWQTDWKMCSRFKLT